MYKYTYLQYIYMYIHICICKYMFITTHTSLVTGVLLLLHLCQCQRSTICGTQLADRGRDSVVFTHMGVCLCVCKREGDKDRLGGEGRARVGRWWWGSEETYSNRKRALGHTTLEKHYGSASGASAIKQQQQQKTRTLARTHTHPQSHHYVQSDR